MRAPRRRTARFIAGTTAVLVALAVPGTALAQTDDDGPERDRSRTERERDERPERDWDLDDLKERILNQIERRLEALERLSEAVAENEHVTPAHAAHLQNDYRAATRLLEDAAEEVEEAETVAELREVVPEVFAKTLVFALLRPKTHQVVASDTAVDIGERFGRFSERLQEIVDRLAANGHDMTAAQAALDEMVALAGEAIGLAGPVADTVIGLDGEDWPEPAKSTLEQGRADLGAARELLKQARGKAHEVIQIVRELLGR